MKTCISKAGLNIRTSQQSIQSVTEKVEIFYKTSVERRGSMSEQWIYLNGQFVRKEDAVVSVYDHGFLYGDGVFEGVRMYSGTVFRLEEHIDRLYESAKSIMLNIEVSKQEMSSIVVETLKKNQLQNAYIRIVVSRGVGNL